MSKYLWSPEHVAGIAIVLALGIFQLVVIVWTIVTHNFSTVLLVLTNASLFLVILLVGYAPILWRQLNSLPIMQEELDYIWQSTQTKTIAVERKTGQHEQYKQAVELLKKPGVDELFLMQRSSSIILGAEACWEEETAFHTELLNAIDTGVKFYHIVSLEGIRKHIERPSSSFPNVHTALNKLQADEAGNVFIKRRRDNGAQRCYIRRLDESSIEVKPDKQARVFLVKYKGGLTEGVLVFDIGIQQSCFLLSGPLMSDYLQECTTFYSDRCLYLTVANLADINLVKNEMKGTPLERLFPKAE